MGQPRQAQELEPVTPSGGDDEQLLELSAGLRPLDDEELGPAAATAYSA